MARSRKPPGRKRTQLPPLMEEFSRWLKGQDHGAVGYLELSDDPPGEGRFEDPAQQARFDERAVPFARLGEGSEIALVDPGDGRPLAVVCLDSEGGETIVARSPEEFLHLLASAETGVGDLDDEDATARGALAAWLKKKGVSAPEAPNFDLGAFLEGSAATGATATSGPGGPPAPSGDGYERLPPGVRRLAMLVGRRADDPELVAFVRDELKKKLPASLSWSNHCDWVEARKKHGIDLVLESHVLHAAYPDIPKSKTSQVPYVASIYLRQGFKDPLPFGLTLDMDAAAVGELLGAPKRTRGQGPGSPSWSRSIDPGRGLVFQVQFEEEEQVASLRVDQARELSGVIPPKPVMGVFVGWAIQRGLLDLAVFGEHTAALAAKVKAREAKGSAFLEAALPRGLWDRHLVDEPGLREFAYDWFHNIGKHGYVRDAFVKAFGGHMDEDGHTAANLAEDSWAAVDKVSGVLDRIFARWIRPPI